MMIKDVHMTEDQQLHMVLLAYDMDDDHVEQIDRVTYVSCSRGDFAMKKAMVSPQQMLKVNAYLSHLHQHDHTASLPFLSSKYAEPFVRLNGQCYYATEWVEGFKHDQYRQDWEKKVLHCLGEMHRLTNSAQFPELHNGKTPYLKLSQIMLRWKRRLKKMKIYKHQIEKKRIPTPFEHVYKQHFTYLSDLGERALLYLNKWQTNVTSNKRKVLCHGQVQRHHIVTDREQNIYILNFEHARMDCPVRELALFFRRHIHHANEWNARAGKDWLASYENQFPLHEQERLLLGIYLLFPEHIFQFAERYFNRHKNELSLKWAQHLVKQIELTQHIRQFIRYLLHAKSIQ